MDAIERRIEWTLLELERLAKSLSRRGYARASEFISKNARLMVTFAKLAVQGIDIPYTSNAIERLMGAIARRCKHGWMHWSTKGLERMLWILLVRYTDEKESFWQAYIHPLSRVRCSQHR
jgi:transposase-like protein